VAALTPVPYAVLLVRSRDALVLAFMTTNLFAVLPLLTEQAKALVREYARTDASATDIIVPASFNVPHAGKVLSLSFLLFAGWFVDSRLRLADYGWLASTGLITMFGNVNAAIPFLLDLLEIPADTFRLFVASAVVNARFGTLVAAVHTLSLAILGTCAVTGTLSFTFSRLVRYAGVTVFLAALVVGSTRMLLQFVLVAPHDLSLALTDMRMLRDRGPAVVVPPATAVPLPPLAESIVDRVRQRGIVRVGYFDDSLPYAYQSRAGALIGFDVEMAMQLAADLGVTAEFVNLRRDVLDMGLNSEDCDIVMSGTVVTPTVPPGFSSRRRISTKPSRFWFPIIGWLRFRTGAISGRWSGFEWPRRRTRTTSESFTTNWATWTWCRSLGSRRHSPRSANQPTPCS
jgi:hypothetical protein